MNKMALNDPTVNKEDPHLSLPANRIEKAVVTVSVICHIYIIREVKRTFLPPLIATNKCSNSSLIN